MSVENWDDDFSGELKIPQRIQQDETVLKEQLGQVKSFAAVMDEIEELILRIPNEAVNEALEKDAVQNAMELVFLSKHDQKGAFFNHEITKEYLNTRDSKTSLEFLRSVEDTEDDVNVDMLTVRRLSKKANELIPQLKSWLASL